MSHIPSVETICNVSILAIFTASISYFVKKFWEFEEKERRKIIKQHVKERHMLPFKHCSDGKCESIAQPQTDYLTMTATDLQHLAQ